MTPPGVGPDLGCGELATVGAGDNTREGWRMSIRLVLYGKVKDGMTDGFKDVGTRMIGAAEGEPGTTTYKWFLSEDGHFVNEDIYTDEAALFAHVGGLTESGLMNEYMGSMDLAGVMVLDPVNDAAKEALAAFAATHYAMIGGF
jgi:hypothetical protein